MIAPAALIIADGPATALIPTLGEFNLAIVKRLGITTGAPRAVVYTSLVRCLFAASYAARPGPLIGVADENARLLIACERFARQTVRKLKLSEAITRNYTPGLPLGSLFNQKQVGLLREMEWMTNPIDLVNHVNAILGKLAVHFARNGEFLSFDDTLTLMLALLSISPPGNAIVIASFLAKWERVQLSKIVVQAKDFFCGGSGAKHGVREGSPGVIRQTWNRRE
jgi:hypothetical protein